MRGRRTVIVVGAGAGHDLDMPLGSALRDLIYGKSTITTTNDGLNRLWADRQIQVCLNALKDQKMAEYDRAMTNIHRTIYSQNSIDDLLDFYRNDEAINLCGKLLIARGILEKEKQSKLAYDTTSAKT
jgi:hypothetical protein